MIDVARIILISTCGLDDLSIKISAFNDFFRIGNENLKQ
jgi:hypothetical protein